MIIWFGPWLLATFLVHNFVHEAAHALVLRHYGAQGVVLHLLPHHSGGTFLWAQTTWTRALLMPTQWFLVAIAPVLAEMLWIVMALTVALSWHWAAWEGAAAAVDIGCWCLGLVTRKPGTDAARAMELLR